jgi:hypothetical protein
MLGSAAAGGGERPEDIPTTSDRDTPMLRLVGHFPVLVALSPAHCQRTRPRSWYSSDRDHKQHALRAQRKLNVEGFLQDGGKHRDSELTRT